MDNTNKGFQNSIAAIYGSDSNLHDYYIHNVDTIQQPYQSFSLIISNYIQPRLTLLTDEKIEFWGQNALSRIELLTYSCAASF